jgi:hypothetical protein
MSTKEIHDTGLDGEDDADPAEVLQRHREKIVFPVWKYMMKKRSSLPGHGRELRSNSLNTGGFSYGVVMTTIAV